MRSLKLGKPFGIEIELHSSFVIAGVLLLGGMLLFTLTGAMQLTETVPVILFIAFLFISVFFHELMHSVVLLDKGFKVEKIILLPIGGISVSEDLPEKPADEFVVSIAGPLFNFFVVFAILAVAAIVGIELQLELLFGDADFFAVISNPLLSLFYVNLVLGTFNLFFPALPLDGGRVARSILAYFIGWKDATNAVSRISSFLAIFLFLIGFFSGNILVAIIALFIFFGAKQESQAVEMKETLRGADILPLLQKKPVVVEGEESLQAVFELIAEKKLLAILVKLDGTYGFISFEGLGRIPRHSWNTVKVKAVAQELSSITLKENAASLMSKALTKGYPLFPVVQGHELIGVIYTRDLHKLYELEKLKKKND